MGTLFYFMGIAICAAVLLQLMLWTSASLASLKHNRTQLEASKLLVQEQIESAKLRRQEKVNEAETWTGYREFYVSQLEKAAQGITSVYLKPVDEKPIPAFSSGQHLPLKFSIPGEPKPVVRCYSLSTGPRQDFYRISVKAVPAPDGQSDVPPGRVSNFINTHLVVGDVVSAKAPSGSFKLNQHSDAPVVLLAGGIGITPILSMLEDLVASETTRTVILLYGVRCGVEHAFKERIAKIAEQHANVHILNCYSEPESSDVLTVDYQVPGWVSVDLIKQLMPNNQCMFYLCGPPPFMESLQTGLLDWGVPENRIRYEAFGPATIKKSPAKPEKNNSSHAASVEFCKSGNQLQWDGQFDSILDLAEANELAIESGCRAGSCKTCSIPLIEGNVQYPDSMDVECEPGECLPCIAIPNGDVKLDV